MGDKFAAFLYDAVLLYAIAVNETLAMGKNPRNGHIIALNMRGKTFQGKFILRKHGSHMDWKTYKKEKTFPVREKSGNFEQTGKVKEFSPEKMEK